jgi:hypothetical protein
LHDTLVRVGRQGHDQEQRVSRCFVAPIGVLDRRARPAFGRRWSVEDEFQSVKTAVGVVQDGYLRRDRP